MGDVVDINKNKQDDILYIYQLNVTVTREGSTKVHTHTLETWHGKEERYKEDVWADIYYISEQVLAEFRLQRIKRHRQKTIKNLERIEDQAKGWWHGLVSFLNR